MSWKIPLFEPDLGPEEAEALVEVVRSKWLTLGERTRRFENEFAGFVGARHAVAVNNGTAALHLALEAVGVGVGDEVVCPALTFVATANAVRYCGARPVFADVASLHDWNISAETVEKVLTGRTRAVLAVHYAGVMCEMGPLTELARRRGLLLVEDAAHAPGARRGGFSAGAAGDAACFSFFSNKNMTTGEGGMVTTNRDDVAELVRKKRSHGMTTLTLDRHRGHAFDYDVVEVGYNYRMSELNAVLGSVQLKALAARNDARRRLADHYRDRLSKIEGLGVPFAGIDGVSAAHIMPVLLPAGADREAVMQALREAGIQSSIHYRPVDTFTAYRENGLGPCEHLERTREIGARTITLPMFATLTVSQIELVCETLDRALLRPA